MQNLTYRFLVSDEGNVFESDECNIEVSNKLI